MCLKKRMEYARWRHAIFALLLPGVFGLLWHGLVCISVLILRLPTGGSPVATYFSCFAKKM
jgi:hypothetical protein